MPGNDESVLRRTARLVGAVLVRPAANGADRSQAVAEPLRSAMKQLLVSSARADREQARTDLYATVLDRLTPDEARILGVLAAGPAFAAVDIVSRGRTVLRNVSTVGEAAGVTLRDEVPTYLSRLAALDLIEIDGESAELVAQYEILAADGFVRQAVAAAKRAKLVRRTVHLSGFGARFWAACDPAKTRAE